MSDNIERIREELPFTCASVNRIVHKRRKDESHEFGKKKKSKKDEKTRERQPVPIDQETTLDTHRTEKGRHNKIAAEENQCGSIIDLEI